MKNKKHFQVQTAIQTGCRNPGTLVCNICKKTYMAGKTPSMFVWFDLVDCSACKHGKKTKPHPFHSHCDWVCSDLCAEQWIVKNK